MIDDIILVADGHLKELVHAARLAVEDYRDLRVQADADRARPGGLWLALLGVDSGEVVLERRANQCGTSAIGRFDGPLQSGVKSAGEADVADDGPSFFQRGTSWPAVDSLQLGAGKGFEG